MKNKIINKLKTKKQVKNDVKDVKITGKTIKEHRQQILDQAKKFKYPLQYEKHKLIINAMIVAMIFFVVAGFATYWQLYKANNTSNFLFKLTQIVPLPVAEIKNQKVLYSDYLAYYRSSIHYYQNKQIKSDSKSELKEIRQDYKKRSFENSLKIAYAKTLAKKYNLKVTNQEKKQELAEKKIYIEGVLSNKAFNKIINNYYGLNNYEYQKIFIEYPILLKKVSLAVDDEAKNTIDLVNQKIKQVKQPDMKKIADYLGNKVSFIDSGKVKIYNNDGGVTKVASKLKIGQISDPIIARSLNGYFIVKLINKDKDELRYQAIRVPLNEFNQRFDQILNKKQYKSYIKIKNS